MSCARSRKTTSSAMSAAESGAPLECASSSRECKYLTDRYGNRKAALTIRARTSGSQAFRAVARAGVVDHTSEDTVGDRARGQEALVGDSVRHLERSPHGMPERRHDGLSVVGPAVRLDAGKFANRGVDPVCAHLRAWSASQNVRSIQAPTKSRARRVRPFERRISGHPPPSIC
jgi:hypothetical protein